MLHFLLEVFIMRGIILAIGELTEDFGYILFYLPYKRGEQKIILSTGNHYFDGVQELANWTESFSSTDSLVSNVRDISYDDFFDYIKSFGPDIEDEQVMYCILDNVDRSSMPTILCFMKSLQSFIRRDLSASEVKKLIIHLRKNGYL